MTAHSSIIRRASAATGQSLPELVSRAASALAAAQSSAEVLEARDIASVVYDAAKKAARMAQAKGAHDAVIAAAHRAQADALVIEAEAKRRLADEYDAAQERGEVAKAGKPNSSGREELPGVDELGLTHKQVHEARQIRDAEEAQPGIVKRTLDRAIADRREPTRAELQRSVLAAVSQAKRDSGRKAKNPLYQPDPFHDKVVRFSGLCEQLSLSADDIGRIAAYDNLTTTRDRLHRNAAAALAVLKKFEEVCYA